MTNIAKQKWVREYPVHVRMTYKDDKGQWRRKIKNFARPYNYADTIGTDLETVIREVDGQLCIRANTYMNALRKVYPGAKFEVFYTLYKDY